MHKPATDDQLAEEHMREYVSTLWADDWNCSEDSVYDSW